MPAEVAFYFYKELGAPVFLKHLENMSRNYRIGSIELGSKSEDMVVVAFHHDLGPNWSTFLSSYLINAAKKMIDTTPSVEASESLVSFRFRASVLAETTPRPSHPA